MYVDIKPNSVVPWTNFRESNSYTIDCSTRDHCPNPLGFVHAARALLEELQFGFPFLFFHESWHYREYRGLKREKEYKEHCHFVVAAPRAVVIDLSERIRSLDSSSDVEWKPLNWEERAPGYFAKFDDTIAYEWIPSKQKEREENSVTPRLPVSIRKKKGIKDSLPPRCIRRTKRVGLRRLSLAARFLDLAPVLKLRFKAGKVTKTPIPSPSPELMLQWACIRPP